MNSGTVIGDQGIQAISTSSIVNAGTITGANGPAIIFGEVGGNTLTITPSSAINGTVLGSGNLLQLGGTDSGVFNVSQIGTNQQYQGFANFEKIGASTWTLTGSGDQNWLISQGTLIGDSSSIQGSAITDNAALVFNQGTAGAFAGSISGTGSFTKIGLGTLTLDGDSSGFVGSTTVAAGALEVGDAGNPGAALGGDVAVNSGATLGGHGTIGGNVINMAGTVAPGGTIGTLTVGGNYVQGSNATLSIEVSPTAASQLKVGGAASLAGKLALLFDPGVYTPTTYKLLTASSVSGTLSSVTGTNPSGLAQMVVINPTDVSLQLSSISPTPVTPVVIAPTNDTIFTAVTNIAILTAQQANGIILDRLGTRASGVADGQVTALVGAVPPTQYAQAGNAAAFGDLASALPRSLASEGAWFRGIGGFASINGSSSAPGFIGETGGFLAGYDRPVTPNVYFGIAGGYLHSDIDEHSTSSGTEGSVRIAAYGGFVLGANLFTATVGYAHDTFETARGFSDVGTANEKHGGNEATAAAQWSLPLQIQGYGGGIAMLTPKAGLQFVHLSENALAETGASGFNLDVGGHDTDSVQPYIGAALGQKFVTDGGTEIIPELRLGYSYEAESNSRLLTVTTVSGANFPVVGVKPSRGQLTGGLGLAMMAGPDLSFYATYDAILPTGNTTEQTVQAGLRWKF